MSGIAEQSERREGGQDRIPTNRIVTIISGHGGEVVTADTVNLGPGGMFVATEDPLVVGDRFICKIDLGEPYKPVLSGAEVCWVNIGRGDKGMGVRFVDIGEAADTLGGSLPTQGPESVRMRLDSVGPALDADVVKRESGGLVVDVSFPFLHSGTHVEVGPDVAARTASIKEVEWLPEEANGLGRMRIWLDLEPSAAREAAGQVVRRDGGPADDRMTSSWQRPAHATLLKREASKALTPRREEKKTELAAVSGDEDLVKEFVKAASSAPASKEKKTQESIRARDELRDAPIFVDAQLVIEDEDEIVDVEEQATAKSDTEEVTSLGSEHAADNEDDLDATSFNPMKQALERVLGAALISRLAPFLGRLATLVKDNVNGPKLRALALRIKDGFGRGWQWTSSRLGPLAKKCFDGIRKIPKIRRRRRQARGEPSNVVRHITDRARKVASGRGKTAAIVVFISLSLIGMATAGYGFWGSESTEQERESFQQEAVQAGWTAEQWEEPEPAEPEA